MTRFLSSSMETASQQPLVKFRILAQVDVRSETIYACTGMQFLSVGANTYTPMGHLGGLDPIREESDVFPRAVRMWLCAVGSVKLAEPLSEALFNKSVRLYSAYVNVNSGTTLVSTPEMRFKGLINRGDIHMGDPDRGNYYDIEVESRLRKQAAAVYFNRETLWAVMSFSGDLFFDYLDKVRDGRAKWGTSELIGYGPHPSPRGRQIGLQVPIYGPTPVGLTPRGG